MSQLWPNDESDLSRDEPESRLPKQNWTELDERGIPIIPKDAAAANAAPPKACDVCHEFHPINGQDPWEWCQQMKTCASTIDWDKVYGHE